MADLETGFRWWIRYVIVPVVAGGGVIAIVVAVLKGEPKPAADRPFADISASSPRILPSAPTAQGSLTVAVIPDTKSIAPDSLATISKYESFELEEADRSRGRGIGFLTCIVSGGYAQ